MKKALILLADGTEEMELYVQQLKHFLIPIITSSLINTTCSTITYDTLVRAGVSCTSAYVPAQNTTSTTTTFSNPPFAKGSRGINILPDTYFSPQETTPVSNLLIRVNGF